MSREVNIWQKGYQARILGPSHALAPTFNPATEKQKQREKRKNAFFSVYRKRGIIYLIY